MESKIFYIEIMNPKLEAYLKQKREKSGQSLMSAQIVVKAGEKTENKRLFLLTLEEIEVLFLDKKVDRKAFKIFGITNKEKEKVPSRIKKKLFELTYLKK